MYMNGSHENMRSLTQIKFNAGLLSEAGGSPVSQENDGWVPNSGRMPSRGRSTYRMSPLAGGMILVCACVNELCPPNGPETKLRHLISPVRYSTCKAYSIKTCRRQVKQILHYSLKLHTTNINPLHKTPSPLSSCTGIFTSIPTTTPQNLHHQQK